MVGPLSFGDILLIVLAFISGMLALYRGLTREVLSLVAWAAAAGAGYYFVANYMAFAKAQSKTVGGSAEVWLWGVAFLIFLVVLVAVHLITMRISDAILDRQLGLVDRILGLMFGLARGFILVVIPYMFYESLGPSMDKQYEWVARSQSIEYVRGTSNALTSALRRFVEAYFPDATPDPAPPDQQGTLETGRKLGSLAPAGGAGAGGQDQLWRLVKADGRTHQFVVRAHGIS